MCNHVCCSASGVAHSIIAAVPLALLSSPARLRSISNYFDIKFQFWRRTMTKIYLSISSNVWIFCHQSECLKVLKTNYFIIYGISFRCSCIFALVSEQWRCNYENSRQVFFPRAVCAQVSLTGDFLYLKTQRKSFHHMKKMRIKHVWLIILVIFSTLRFKNWCPIPSYPLMLWAHPLLLMNTRRKRQYTADQYTHRKSLSPTHTHIDTHMFTKTVFYIQGAIVIKDVQRERRRRRRRKDMEEMIVPPEPGRL